MAEMKIATFNVEWMTAVFGAIHTGWDGAIPDTFPGKFLGDIFLEPIADVHALCGRIAGVIEDIDCHIVGIEEGPSRKEQMELFVQEFLDDDYVVYKSPANPVWQSVYALVRRSIANEVVEWTPAEASTASLWKNLPYYPWGQIAADQRKQHDFARAPLLLDCTLAPGKSFKLVVLHTKSKFSKLKTLQQWLDRDEEAVLDALNARVKLSAEIAGLRGVMNAYAENLPVLIIGDFNDGAFADLMEKEFLIHNIIDELAGTMLHPETYFQHAMDPNRLASAVTVSFPDPLNNGEITNELIDHVIVSKAIWNDGVPFKIKQASCIVEDAAYQAHNDETPANRARGLRPSDHRPVSVVLQY